MKVFTAAKGFSLIIGAAALALVSACSDQGPAQTEAPEGETPAVTQEQQTPEDVQNNELNGAELAFYNLDANQDQQISSEEAAANLGISSEFALIDLDSDGAINLDEFKEYAGEATAAGGVVEEAEEVVDQAAEALQPAETEENQSQ